MQKTQHVEPRGKASWIARTWSWLRKPLEQKVFGLGGRLTTLRYARWVKAHGYHFSGILHPHELLSEATPSLAHSTHYLVSDVYSLELLLHEAQVLLGAPDLFIDIGCGKGMPPLYASRFHGYKATIGMDFSAKLIQEAEANLERSGDLRVHFIQADATDFTLPEQQAVVYLHNPFGPELLKTFLQHNLEHFRTQGSLIAYAFDVHRHVLSELDFDVMYRSSRFSHSLWQLRGAQPPE